MVRSPSGRNLRREKGGLAHAGRREERGGVLCVKTVNIDVYHNRQRLPPANEKETYLSTRSVSDDDQLFIQLDAPFRRSAIRTSRPMKQTTYALLDDPRRPLCVPFVAEP